MTVLSETAYAKINLALHVRARRTDGYHELETVFAFVDQGDGLIAVSAPDLSLTITGPFSKGLSNGPDNLVLCAAEALRSAFDVTGGTHLTLDKRLPIASGIGGGSADAAAAARLLNRLWQLRASDEKLAEILAPLGADIPACLASHTLLGQGTGTELTIYDNAGIAGLPVLLVNPRKSLSTGPVFAAWDGKDGGALAQGNVWDAVLAGRNDLQGPAIGLCPEIVGVLNVLESTGPLLSRMSGSGATCFAVFESAEKRDDAAKFVDMERPDYWMLSGTLR
jgi:4-diphosphocytidyl-2-C-methyl-D-erythritol kinase